MTDETSAPAPDQAAPAPAPVPARDSKEKGEKGKKGAVIVGTAVGVGSAAVVAALMYASKRRK